MIRRCCTWLVCLWVGCTSLPVYAAQTLSIGYMQQSDDPRYDDKHMTAQFLGQALGRPYEGAEVALKEVKFHGQNAGVEFALESAEAATAAELIKQVETLQAKGVRFILSDLPAATLSEVASAFKGKDVVFFNVSAPDDSLRQAQCQAVVFHTLPNHAMQADALVQYLVAHKWKQVLVLEGEAPEDKLLTAAFERAAKRYGAEIVAKRPFVLGNDPRERDKNNIALLTGDEDYDVVYIADSHGEFARNAAYQTLLPRPVIGSEGLNALAWNWAWERHGAPQVEKRFEKKAERRMSDPDWAAWMAVKAIATAVQQTNGADFVKLRDFLTAPDTTLDGAKGNASSFRPWDHQLRQPLLLSTHNWVVDRAPLEGFLHQTNNLDTLGFDERDSQCKF
ncbi:ABC transporter substrate-binding protein [Thiothrix fructosivorans]|uniref:ABC transporter substrate-binding protein n=1 Tax=Thiothrix fructosivorans TaxID=111770 RepID=A0A8B0SSP2_9GAMM|nr:ABC transporter substrate-binding protein [Thiothrix fructosivorans]MBO0612607.1 ABC transporter substrate-binding protein [Thiothrix fructosivorans]QTX11922.1 ABC transporter substrate-binding protein [Thiothrix fructosivorans]